MKKSIYKDIHKRKTVLNFMKKKTVLKCIYKNSCLTTFIRWKALNSLVSLPKNTSLTRVKSRCIVTGKSSKNNKFYRFSRLTFLRLARSGSISGLRKST